MREVNSQPALGYAVIPPVIKQEINPETGKFQEWDNSKSHVPNYGSVQSFRNLGTSHAR